MTVASATLLVACGDGGGDSQANDSGANSVANSAPTISGTPSTSTVQGAAYVFQPAASDANGDTLTFAVNGAPAWAKFDPATGALSGAPTAGVFANVAISVSDGKSTAWLPAFSITVGSAVATSGNTMPTIEGKPLEAVLRGRLYSFAPTADDADGEMLTFRVSGLPKWAVFNDKSGRISGTPKTADIGTYTGVVISVTDGLDTVALPPFAIDVVGTANGSVTLSWERPSENDDGTPLTDLAGYHVYWGTDDGQYTNFATVADVGITSFVVDQLTAATWYFATTAFNSDGVESEYSDTRTTTIR